MTCCSAPMSSLSCHFKHYKRMKAAASGFAYLYMRRRAPLRSKQQAAKQQGSEQRCLLLSRCAVAAVVVGRRLHPATQMRKVRAVFSIHMYVYVYVSVFGIIRSANSGQIVHIASM